jgi:hypothetical protein
MHGETLKILCSLSILEESVSVAGFQAIEANSNLEWTRGRYQVMRVSMEKKGDMM